MILLRILSWWKHIQAFLEPKATSETCSWGAEGGGGLSHVQNLQRSKQWSLSGKVVAHNYVTLYIRGFPIHAAQCSVFHTDEGVWEWSYSTYTSSTEPSTLSALLTPDVRGSVSMMRELQATSASNPPSNGTPISLVWKIHSSMASYKLIKTILRTAFCCSWHFLPTRRLFDYTHCNSSFIHGHSANRNQSPKFGCSHAKVRLSTGTKHLMYTLRLGNTNGWPWFRTLGNNLIRPSVAWSY